MTTECPCGKSEMDIFRPIDVNIAMTQGRWQTYFPINGLSPNATLVEFSIPGSNNEMIDLNNISLYIRGAVKAGTTDITGTEKVFPANNLLHSMIRHIDVSINGQLITRADRNYAYRAYLKKVLMYDLAKADHLLHEGFLMDSPGTPDDIQNANTKNKAGVERAKWIAESKTLELIGCPAIDFFETDRMLHPGCDIQLRIYFNDPKFYLIDNNTTANARKTNYVFNFDEVELNVRRVKIAPSFLNALQTEIQEKDAIYPFTRSEILTFGVPTGSLSVVKENLFRGHAATRFFVAMVESTNYGGSFTTSPFEFKHFGLREISLSENGSYIATNPLKIDLDTDGKRRWRKAYRMFLESVGGVGERAPSLAITEERWVNCSTIFAFTRSPDLSHGLNHLPPQTASITLNLTFDAALTADVTVIVMAEYDSRIQIMKDNNLVTDYSI